VEAIGRKNLTSSGIASATFFVTTGILLYVPLVRIVPYIDTFIHPWRAELATGLITPLFVIIFVWRRAFLASQAQVVVYPIAAFVVLSLVSSLWAESERSVIHHSGIWATYLLVFVLAYNFSTSAVGRTAAFWTLAGISLALAVPAAIEFLIQGISGTSVSLTGRYSRYAELLNVLLPLLGVAALTRSGWLQRISFIAFCATFLLPFLVARRAPIVVVVGELCTMLAVVFFSKRLRAIRRSAAVLSATAIGVALLVQVASWNFVSGIPIVERGESKLTHTSDQLRSVIQQVALEMFRTHPVLGVGADNFGREYQNYRPLVAARSSSDPAFSIAQDQIAERAHNEPLQIASELGIGGLLIFALIMGVLIICLYHRWRSSSEPLLPLAALIGIFGFLLSSLVSSFSFRILPNGIAFFLVAAIGFAAHSPDTDGVANNVAPQRPIRFIVVTATILVIAMAVVAGISAWAVELQFRAMSVSDDIPRANELFKRAERHDPENAAILFSNGEFALANHHYLDAASLFESSITNGRIAVTTYSYAASAYSLAKRNDLAVDVLTRGLEQYPSSVFLLVRRSVINREVGRTDDAQKDLEKAKDLDSGQAQTWQNLIENGAINASKQSFDRQLPTLMDLDPRGGVYAVLAEREILHPEEKPIIPGMKGL